MPNYEIVHNVILSGKHVVQGSVVTLDEATVNKRPKFFKMTDKKADTFIPQGDPLPKEAPAAGPVPGEPEKDPKENK